MQSVRHRGADAADHRLINRPPLVSASLAQAVAIRRQAQA
jgi:hypothetical protein